MTSALKEAVFGFLFLIVIVLIIGIIFYEFIPNQIIPEATKYTQTSDTAKLLTQIQTEQKTEQEEKETNVLQSYEVTSDDLAVSGSRALYDQGKNDPFVDYTKLKTNEGVSSDTGVAGTTTSRDSSSTTTSSFTSSASSDEDGSTETTPKPSVDTSTLRDVSDRTTSTK